MFLETAITAGLVATVALWLPDDIAGIWVQVYQFGLPPAGFFAVVAAVFLFSLLGAFGKVATMSATDEYKRGLSAGDDDEMKSWIRFKMSARKLAIRKVILFGSVVRRDPTRDVDVIVQFKDASEATLRKRVSALRQLDADFFSLYEHHLHFQFFADGEDGRLRSFLEKAGPIEVLVGDL